MGKKFIIVAMSLGLSMVGTAAFAGRLVDGALGAGAGAIVGGPVGAVAGGVIGYTAGPTIDCGLRGGCRHHVRYRHHTRYNHQQ